MSDMKAAEPKEPDFETLTQIWGMTPGAAREYLAFVDGTFQGDVIGVDPETGEETPYRPPG